MNNSDCLFCRIASHELPATIRFEDEAMIAFDDIHPKAPVHVLLVPKFHVASMNDVSEDPKMVGALLLCLKKLAREFGLAEAGYRIVINTGRGGGQVIDHLHLHLLGGGKPGLGNFI